MSREIHVDIPTSLGKPMRISATAADGRISLTNVRARILGRNNILTTTAQVDAGRGLVIGVGPASLYCLFDEREYAGLVSAREGGGRRGSIDIAAFVEGIQNGTAEYADSGNDRLDDRRDARHDRRKAGDTASAERAAERAPRVKARQDRRAARRADRLERRGREPEVPTVHEGDYDSMQRMLSENTAEIAVGPSFARLRPFPSQSSIHGTTFDLGAGELGYDSMSATLADTASDTFEITGSLDSQLSVGTHEILADSLQVKDVGGAPATLHSARLRGLQVVIDRPLEMSRTITTTIEAGNITRVAYGDRVESHDETTGAQDD